MIIFVNESKELRYAIITGWISDISVVIAKPHFCAMQVRHTNCNLLKNQMNIIDGELKQRRPSVQPTTLQSNRKLKQPQQHAILGTRVLSDLP